jgi:hypothetical protein
MMRLTVLTNWVEYGGRENWANMWETLGIERNYAELHYWHSPHTPRYCSKTGQLD